MEAFFYSQLASRNHVSLVLSWRRLVGGGVVEDVHTIRVLRLCAPWSGWSYLPGGSVRTRLPKRGCGGVVASCGGMHVV